MSANENQIVVYQPNETVRIDVCLENETVWLLCGWNVRGKVAFARGLAAASQFARTLLRLCFAKLLVLLVGGT